MGSVSSFLPFNNWKQALGLFVVVVVFVVVANKYGVTSKVSSAIGG